METLRHNEDRRAWGELSLVTHSNCMPLLPRRVPIVPIPSLSLNKYVLKRERTPAETWNERAATLHHRRIATLLMLTP